jgi:serine/threonine protein phosphatase 1
MENKKVRTFTLGDLHGNYRGLLQVLERSGFDKKKDRLIFLGDVFDGYSESYECIEELLTIENLIFIRGNHDDIFLDWMNTGRHGFDWNHGGDAVIKNYAKHSDRDIFCMPDMGGFRTNLTFMDIPKTHRDLLHSSISYFVEDDICFTHGGFNRHSLVEEQKPSIFLWDRDLWSSALSWSETSYPYKIKDNFKKIFIGHTPTINWKTNLPKKASVIWNIDTGGGYKEGKVTIMNVDTEEYFQSDLNSILYPDERGR